MSSDMSRSSKTKVATLGVMAVFLIIMVTFGHWSDSTDSNDRYAVMVDAGSSGSRIFVYKLSESQSGSDIPLNVEQHKVDGKAITMKVEPGLSAYVNTPEEAFASLKPGLAYAAKYISHKQHKNTPVYVFGTAGLRAIGDEPREQILEAIRKGIRRDFRFYLEDENVAAISGEREAIYAWVTANYILGSLGKGESTRGIVDLGGGSMQIAYEAPRDGPWKNSVETIHFSPSAKFNVFRVTHPGFGMQSAHAQFGKHLEKKQLSVNPCLPIDAKEKSDERSMKGGSNFKQCEQEVRQWLSSYRVCDDLDNCNFRGQSCPPIDSKREFMGFSEYWYGTYDILGISGRYDMEQLRTISQNYCSKNMEELLQMGAAGEYPGVPKDQVTSREFWVRRQCFKSAYIPATLEMAWGFSPNMKNFESHLKVNGEELQWTLGALLMLETDTHLSGGHGLGFYMLCMLLIASVCSAAYIYTRKHHSTQLLTKKYVRHSRGLI